MKVQTVWKPVEKLFNIKFTIGFIQIEEEECLGRKYLANVKRQKPEQNEASVTRSTVSHYKVSVLESVSRMPDQRGLTDYGSDGDAWSGISQAIISFQQMP